MSTSTSTQSPFCVLVLVLVLAAFDQELLRGPADTDKPYLEKILRPAGRR